MKRGSRRKVSIVLTLGLTASLLSGIQQASAQPLCDPFAYRPFYEPSWDEMRQSSLITCGSLVVKKIHLRARIYRANGELKSDIVRECIWCNVLQYWTIKDCIGHLTRTYYGVASGWYKATSNSSNVSVGTDTGFQEQMNCSF
jgi:hypothetical protein